MGTIHRRAARHPQHLPRPDEPRVAWFVREPFPSVSTGTKLNFGFLEKDSELVLISEMGEDGVIFGDGIESDRIEFISGQSLRIRLDAQTLRLVMPVARLEKATAQGPRDVRRVEAAGRRKDGSTAPEAMSDTSPSPHRYDRPHTPSPRA